MPDIFLSYNRNDQATARRFAEGFEREGLSVWWDQTLRSGEAYDKVTEKALEEAKAVVVLWSKTSVDSRWVRAEATQADRNGTLVPVMIEVCKRPIMFELTHTADLIKWKGDPGDAAWQSYVADVRQFVNKDGSTREAARPVVGKSRKFRGVHIAISAAVLLLASGMLYWALHRMPGKGAAASTTVAATSAQITLAVLPFANPDGSEASRVLAFGVAEAVTDQLTNLSELSVIAWSSASGISSGTQSLRDIARQLGVAYLVTGSVQRSGEILRVRARLVEAATERSVWSLQLNHDQKDVFSIQDEIAAQVTRALSVSVSAEGRDRMRGQGTHNVEAYLAFLEGQDALATWRTREAGIAASHFNRAVGLDPQFARAMIMLVRARMRDAEQSSGPDQRDQVAKALKELPPLIERALAIDPRLGEAYVERGDLRIYDDLEAAERDYRKAIELSPSNARAYQQLAALLYDDPSRRREVAEPLQRARTLDPLDQDLAVTWALYQFYEFGNAEEGEKLLRQVLERNPQFLPALIRRGEMLIYGLGRTAEGIGVLEDALKLDPDSDQVRRLLVQGYIASGDFEHARLLARQPGATELNQMFLDLAEQRVDRAARVAYEAINAGTLVGTDQWAIVEAVELDARRTRKFVAAGLALDELLDIHWMADGTPVLNRNRGLITDVLSYAGMLRAAGDDSRATALLNAADQAVKLDEKERGGVNPWNTSARARIALLKGDNPTALNEIENACKSSVTCWYWISLDPLFEPLRGTTRFKAIAASLDRGRDPARKALQPH